MRVGRQALAAEIFLPFTEDPEYNTKEKGAVSLPSDFWLVRGNPGEAGLCSQDLRG